MLPERPRILLTNDDGHASPLFLLAIETLAAIGELDIAVPAEEQSWKSKSMSRFEPLYVDAIEIAGRRAWSITGTPADCVNLAIHNLLPARPDIVVSGINVGLNTGLGMLLASGTVGACIEANIAGVPGLALSQHLRPRDYRGWSTERTFDDTLLAELGESTRALLPRLWAAVAPGCDAPVTWSANLPIGAGADAPIVAAHLGASFYGQCFVRHGDQYRHELQPFEVDPDPASDARVVRDGCVSLTRIDVRRLVERGADAAASVT